MRRAATDQKYRELAAAALADKYTPATIVHAIILSEYGLDFLYGDDPAEPAEIWENIKDDFRVEISEENKNRLMAMTIAVAGDPCRDFDTFASIVLAFADGDIGDVLIGIVGDDLDFGDAIAAVYEIELNREPPVEYGTEVANWFARKMMSIPDPEAEADDAIEKLKTKIGSWLIKLGTDPEIVERALVYDEALDKKSDTSDNTLSAVSNENSQNEVHVSEIPEETK